MKVEPALILAFMLVATFVVPVLAVGLYRPGVKVGDYVKLKFELGGNTVAALDPSYPYNNVDWVECTIASVSGNEVTMHWKDHYKNGTLASDYLSYRWDVVTGEGYWGSNYEGEDLTRWVLSADLETGDPIRAHGSDRVDRIENRTYLGARREVAVVFLSWEKYGYDWMSTCIFDRSSGMLLERELKAVNKYSWSGGEAGTYETESLSLLETNIFSSSNGGSAPDDSVPSIVFPFPIEYVFIPVVAISIGAFAVFFLARKKRAAVAQPSRIPNEQPAPVYSSEPKTSTPSSPEPPPPPSAVRASFCTECGTQLESNDKFCLNCGTPREA